MRTILTYIIGKRAEQILPVILLLNSARSKHMGNSAHKKCHSAQILLTIFGPVYAHICTYEKTPSQMASHVYIHIYSLFMYVHQLLNDMEPSYTKFL